MYSAAPFWGIRVDYTNVVCYNVKTWNIRIFCPVSLQNMDFLARYAVGYILRIVVGIWGLLHQPEAW